MRDGDYDCAKIKKNTVSRIRKNFINAKNIQKCFCILHSTIIVNLRCTLEHNLQCFKNFIS